MPRFHAFEEMTKHTLYLYAGDYRRLQEVYPEVGAALVIRTLIKRHLDQVDKPADLSQIKLDPQALAGLRS